MQAEAKYGGFEYWDHVLGYVYDVISIIDDTTSTMKYIKSKFTLKGFKVEELDMYLRAKIYNIVNVGVFECFGFSSEKYITVVVKSVE